MTQEEKSTYQNNNLPSTSEITVKIVPEKEAYNTQKKEPIVLSGEDMQAIFGMRKESWYQKNKSNMKTTIGIAAAITGIVTSVYFIQEAGSEFEKYQKENQTQPYKSEPTKDRNPNNKDLGEQLTDWIKEFKN